MSPKREIESLFRAIWLLALLTFATLPASAARHRAVHPAPYMPGACRTATVNDDLAGIQFFPLDNPWNTPIEGASVDPASNAMMASMCPTGCAGLLVETAMPINVICGITASTRFAFRYQSDPGPYPVTSLIGPREPWAGQALRQETGTCGSSECNDDKDHHVLIMNRSDMKLYELYQPYQDASGQWHGAAGAIFDITSNVARPDGSPSADGAGLPILPGLLRCDEVRSGEIRHALRVTLSQTKRSFVRPATHCTYTGGAVPMGARFRLKASFDRGPFTPAAQTILRALKKYGMIVADNGTPFGITAETADSCWVDLGLTEYHWSTSFYLFNLASGQTISGNNFEIVTMGTEHNTGCE
jgi:hypothetical protein